MDMLIEAGRLVTVGYKLPNGGRASQDFRPKRVNRVPADLWGALRAKPAVERLLEDGVLKDVSPSRAQAITEGEAWFSAGAGARPPRVPDPELPQEMPASTRAAVEDLRKQLADSPAEEVAVELPGVKAPPVPRSSKR